ncbi:MAG: PBECR4 domain-containing protein [Oscillospiraceae bacterium]
MDKLQECAKSFEKLLDKKYHIIIGRKGKSTDIELAFETEDFHHLIGLHKLKDIEALSGKRGKVFRDVLNGHIPLSSIEKSPYFNQIKNRIEPFSDLEKILDDNHLVFKFNEKTNSFSLMQAEYLLATSYKANDIYIFLDRKGKEEEFFCRSFFPKENRDYTIGQIAYTLLFKEKITISSGEKEIQYDRLSPSGK